MRKVVSTREMRHLEGIAVERGIALQSLMERAGEKVGKIAAERSGGGRILVLVGPGNNGGDGLVAAELLRQAGYDVAVYAFRRAGSGKFEASIVHAEDDLDFQALRELMAKSTVLIDALLGVGQDRAPEGMLSQVLRVVHDHQHSGLTTLAVDIPTGVNADTGAVPREAVRADITICMGYLKRGVILSPGRELAGETLVADVGLPNDLHTEIAVSVAADSDIAGMLPVRHLHGNKGSYGRLVVLGGSREFVGASTLVGSGAYRAGAGLVELVVTAAVQQAVAGSIPEAIYRVLPGNDGRLSKDSLPHLDQVLKRASAVVLGPGMGSSHDSLAFTIGTLQAMDREGVRAAVVDADGLNALSQLSDWWDVKTPLVLTPHPGEMSRLTRRSIETIQANRIDTALHYAMRWRKVVVLKGAGTVIAAPHGQAVINTTGGPNLATAGTGDVLSGIIGGLLAQGCDPWRAAVVGTYLHGYAGDLLRAKYGDAGTVASDVPRLVPEARHSIIQAASGGSLT